MDFDSLLNYEKDCFQKGFKEGTDAGKLQGHTEGRELGVQTGYQRYLALGVLQARVDAWKKEEVGPFEQLEALASMVAVDSVENDPLVVEDIDRRIKLAKNKARTIAAARKAPKVVAHEQQISYQRDSGDTAAIEDMY